MILRELLQSVDAEAYASVPLFEELLNTKPEYGSSNRIKVKVLNGEIAVSNVHLGSLGDIVACPIDVAPDLQVTKIAGKHLISESRVLRIVRDSERKLQFSDDAIEIWKYLYRR